MFLVSCSSTHMQRKFKEGDTTLEMMEIHRSHLPLSLQQVPVIGM